MKADVQQHSVRSAWSPSACGPRSCPRTGPGVRVVSGARGRHGPRRVPHPPRAPGAPAAVPGRIWKPRRVYTKRIKIFIKHCKLHSIAFGTARHNPPTISQTQQQFILAQSMS